MIVETESTAWKLPSICVSSKTEAIFYFSFNQIAAMTLFFLFRSEFFQVYTYIYIYIMNFQWEWEYIVRTCDQLEQHLHPHCELQSPWNH